MIAWVFAVVQVTPQATWDRSTDAVMNENGMGAASVDRSQVACGVTWTTAKTHAIIAERLTESAVYGGRALGRGPRYCPSIEDKVVRFADKASHQIFLEPEGRDDDTVYPNGISTSVSEETQAVSYTHLRAHETGRNLV